MKFPSFGQYRQSHRRGRLYRPFTDGITPVAHFHQIKMDGGPHIKICYNMQIHAVSTREKELQSQVIHLQQSIGTLVEELQRQKLKNAQVERHLNAVANKVGKVRRGNGA
ncbi:unnamed protein product, partial [Vitis vinifera]